MGPPANVHRSRSPTPMGHARHRPGGKVHESRYASLVGASARCSPSSLSAQRQSRYGISEALHHRRQPAPAPRSQHLTQPGKAARQTPGQHDKDTAPAHLPACMGRHPSGYVYLAARLITGRLLLFIAGQQPAKTPEPIRSAQCWHKRPAIGPQFQSTVRLGGDIFLSLSLG